MMKPKISSKRVVAIAKKLRENLNASEIDFKNKSKDRLPVDLTDVYTICVNCKFLIEQLLEEKNWTETENLRKLIHEIQNQLFTHLPYHYRPLEKTLEKIYWQITTDENVDRDMKEMFVEIDKFLAESDKKRKRISELKICPPEKKIL